MLGLVLGALVAAGLANVRAHGTYRFGMLAGAGHGRRSECTDLSAVDVECDAASHRLDVRLLQAGNCAMIAGHGAGVARFDTRVEFLVRHFGAPEFESEGDRRNDARPV